MKASERMRAKHFCIHSKLREKFMTSAPPFKSQGIKVLLLHTKSKLNWSLRLTGKSMNCSDTHTNFVLTSVYVVNFVTWRKKKIL